MNAPQPAALLLLLTVLSATAAPRSAQANGEPVFTQSSGAGWNSEAPDPTEGFRRVDWDGWESLPDLLLDLHANTGVPAIAAAVVRDGVVLEASAVGLRSVDSAAPVTDADRFHLGSLTKSITALVVGKLVEEGKLGWDMTVRELWPDLPMQASYGRATLEQLLQHLAGFPGYTDGRPADHPADAKYAGSPTEKRAQFLKHVLQTEPVGQPGERFVYSNAGYALAGHLAERIAGSSWEALVRRIVFEPLGMKSAGFGIPESPSGHVYEDGRYFSVPIDAYPELETIAPAGNVHASISDLAKYAAAHLAGLAGEDGIVTAQTLRRLHTAPEGSPGYAAGWMLRDDRGVGPVHWHGGTVGASFAELRLVPGRRSAVMVLTNVARRLGEPIANRVGRALLDRYAPPLAGFVSAPADGERAQGQLDVVEVDVDPGADARLWRVVRKLSEALNNEDRAAYHALFATDEKRDDRDSMFDFMARSVLPSRGAIESFHAPSKALHIGGSEQAMRMVTFHLENGFPGFYGFTLDPEDRIVELSLFVKGDVCPQGSDPDCDSVVRRMGEDFE